MITLADAWLASALAGNAPPEVVADWLVDRGATPAGVLLLYAGNPPEWRGGIGNAVLAAWVRHSADRPVPPDPRERGRVVTQVMLSDWIAAQEPPLPEMAWPMTHTFLGYFPGANRRVLAHCPYCRKAGISATRRALYRASRRVFRHHQPHATFGANCRPCGAVLLALRDDGPEVRAMKRAVLAHFPDVDVYCRPVYVGRPGPARVLSAADLILPEGHYLPFPTEYSGAPFEGQSP